MILDRQESAQWEAAVKPEDLRQIHGHWEIDLPQQVIRKDLYWMVATTAAIWIALEEHDDRRWVPLSSVEAEGIQSAHSVAVRDCARA